MFDTTLSGIIKHVPLDVAVRLATLLPMVTMGAILLFSLSPDSVIGVGVATIANLIAWLTVIFKIGRYFGDTGRRIESLESSSRTEAVERARITTKLDLHGERITAVETQSNLVLAMLHDIQTSLTAIRRTS